ncbi:MAG: AAA family ATPase [Saprospirales bacterium]|nr:AAA family ATPase [Saprospirales bacterium]
MKNKAKWRFKNFPSAQDFRKIRENDFKYIDKTRYIYQAAKIQARIFSPARAVSESPSPSPPCRELYSGSRELFRGLWIEDKWDWSRKHPVIRITLTGIGYPEVSLPEALNFKLNLLIEEAGFPAAQGTPGNRLEYLIARLSAKGKVVVLIDECDAPVIHHLGKDPAKPWKPANILKEFYTVLKTTTICSNWSSSPA